MALRNLKQVTAGNDALAGAAMRNAAPAVKTETTDRIVEAAKAMPETGDDKADYAAAREMLGAALLIDMGTEALTDAVAKTTTQAALIGRTTATPKETPKRRNGEASKR